MKIISIKSPPAGHKSRGIGFYTQRLLEAMHQLAPTHGLNIQLFDQNPSPHSTLVHYPYFDLFKHTLPYAKLFPTIVSILDVIPLAYPDHYPPGLRGQLNLFLQKLSLQNVKHVLTISAFSQNQITKFLKIPQSHITVTALAADDQFKPQSSPILQSRISQKYKLPKKFVLYVGDINWNKNLSRLTQACLNAGLDLVIVGKNALSSDLYLNHPELTHFKNWLDLYAHHPQVHRVGFVSTSDLVTIYNLATCYCQPSISEGFGLSLLEAMSCGTPCACSNQSSLPEVGGNGVLYFDPENVEEMTQTIKKLTSNKTLAEKIGKKGLEQSKFFSWNQTAALTIDTYLKFI